MSQHWIYINSASYRRFIEASKEKRGLLFATGAALGGISMLVGYLVANATNPNFEAEGYMDKQAELAKLPMHAQAIARSQREQLRAMLLDVTSGNDTDRYRSLMDGKIHNTKHGTSMPDAPK